MRTSLLLLILGMVSSLGVTSAAAGVELLERYESERTSLEFFYDVVDAGPQAGALREFVLPTALGDLHGHLSSSPASAEARTVLWLGGADDRVTTVLQPSAEGGLVLVRLDFSAHGTLDYVLEASSGEWHLVDSTVDDCEALARSSLYRAIIDGARALTADADAGVPVSEESAVIASALALPALLPELDDDCRDHTGRRACGWDHETYAACSACCDADAFLGLLCSWGTAGVPCRHPVLCSAAKSLICDGIVWLDAQLCEETDCRGLPGDPHCKNPPPCAEGWCYIFCPPGDAGDCGTCVPGRRCCKD